MFILPTYKRPKRLAEFFEASVGAGMTLPGIVVVQGSDQKQEYEDAVKDIKPDNWTIAVSQTNVGMVAATNWILEHRPQEEWYAMVGDDMLPSTEGFDVKMLSLTSPWSITSCMDNSKDVGWRTAGCMMWGGELVRTVGFLLPPVTWHICGDDWWQLVGKAFSIWNVAADVRINTKSAIFAGGEWDETQKTGYARFQDDMQKYHRWLADQGGEVMERLRVVMQANGVLSNTAKSRFVVSHG